jgi:hypothetical protein
MIFQDRGRKDQQGKPPDQAGIDEMYTQVNKMVVPDIQLVKMIIKGKGENADRPVGTEIPPGSDISRIPDTFIIYDTVKIVKMERTIEGV